MSVFSMVANRMQVVRNAFRPRCVSCITTCQSVERWSSPRLDLQENPDTNVVTAKFELPGKKRDDVNIDNQNDRLSVSGKTSGGETRDEGNYVVRERTYGEFSRTLSSSPGTKVCARSWAEIGVLLDAAF